jgi:hypothetical protein
MKKRTGEYETKKSDENSLPHLINQCTKEQKLWTFVLHASLRLIQFD